MISLLNFFYNSNFFDHINPFVAKKIFKIFKIFFVKTKLKTLPPKNYKINESQIVKEFADGKFFEQKENKPYITYTHLLDLMSLMKNKETLNFFDYGAGNLNLFFYLRKNIEILNYFFFDQTEILNLLQDFNKIHNLNKLNICNNQKNDKIDLVYFGSSLQYLNNYKDEISRFKNSAEYLLISQTPFFKNDNLENEHIVLKQVNMHPNINFLYSFNYNYFIRLMENNNFKLINKSHNRVTKFLNFKNFKNEYKELDMYDLFFKKYEK